MSQSQSRSIPVYGRYNITDNYSIESVGANTGGISQTTFTHHATAQHQPPFRNATVLQTRAPPPTTATPISQPHLNLSGSCQRLPPDIPSATVRSRLSIYTPPPRITVPLLIHTKVTGPSKSKTKEFSQYRTQCPVGSNCPHCIMSKICIITAMLSYLYRLQRHMTIRFIKARTQARA